MRKRFNPNFKAVTGSLSLYGFESTKGELNPNAKLTNQQVLEIRASTIAAGKLALQYGVSVQCIYQVRSRRTYRDVK